MKGPHLFARDGTKIESPTIKLCPLRAIGLTVGEKAILTGGLFFWLNTARTGPLIE